MSSNDITISADGSIYKGGSGSGTSGWSINSDGKAYFKNIDCTQDFNIGDNNNYFKNTGFNFAANGTSWGAGAFSGGGGAQYYSDKNDPFGSNNGCTRQISTLSVNAFEAKYIEAGYIKSQYINASKIVTKELILNNLNVGYGSMAVAVLKGTKQLSGSCSITIDDKSYTGSVTVSDCPNIDSSMISYVAVIN